MDKVTGFGAPLPPLSAKKPQEKRKRVSKPKPKAKKGEAKKIRKEDLPWN